MRIFVGVTDKDWFGLHASRSNVEEVNFWRPSPTATFKALDPGELFLFKLHAPENFLVGGGFFTKFQQLPVNLAWDAFREANGTGRELWTAVEERLRLLPPALFEEETATLAAIESHGFGKPQIVLPRLGQGSFRIVVTDAYGRRCAFTGERTLPVLEAAHIRPYAIFPKHEVPNGLLLRSDLHKLFDEGYVTIDPADRKILVSPRIREEFENGKEYYRLHGVPIREPAVAAYRPSVEHLEYHAYTKFR